MCVKIMRYKKYIIIFLVFQFVLISFSFAADPFAEAKKLSDKGRYADAIKLYMDIKQRYPGSDWVPQCIMQMARTYEKMKKYDDAVAEYKNIIEKYPTLNQAEEAYFVIARIRTSQNLFQPAIRAYELYIKNYPKGDYTVMAYFNAASLYKDTGKTTEALKYFGEILKDYTNQTWFYSWAAIYSGDIYVGRRDFDAAIESYQRVIRSDKNKVLYALALLHRAQACMEKNDFITAKAVFNALLRSNNFFQEEALYGLGKSHYKLGEYELAREVYTSLLQMFPDTVWRKNAEKGLKLMDKRISKQRTEPDDDL